MDALAGLRRRDCGDGEGCLPRLGDGDGSAEVRCRGVLSTFLTGETKRLGRPVPVRRAERGVVVCEEGLCWFGVQTGVEVVDVELSRDLVVKIGDSGVPCCMATMSGWGEEEIEVPGIPAVVAVDERRGVS